MNLLGERFAEKCSAGGWGGERLLDCGHHISLGPLGRDDAVSMQPSSPFGSLALEASRVYIADRQPDCDFSKMYTVTLVLPPPGRGLFKTWAFIFFGGLFFCFCVFLPSNTNLLFATETKPTSV